MAEPRSKVVQPDTIGVYHCISRCVRRAFLCGYDHYTGQSYEHRRGWVQNRIYELSNLFGVDVFAYAIMSNHSHIVLRNRPDLAAQWTAREVAERWCQVFPGSHRVGDDAWNLRVESLIRDPARLAEVRARLADISWFMRCLNEWIARRANHEDECSGHFWEGRFRCQALVDEGAILACMVYVDLNPVRAALASGLEDSCFTSVYDRLNARRAEERLRALGPLERPTQAQRREMDRETEKISAAAWLAPLSQTKPFGLSLDLDRYLDLVQWTLRALPGSQPGDVPMAVERVLDRFSLDAQRWAENVAAYGSLFHRIVGRSERLAEEARQRGQRWFRGQAGSRRLYGQSRQAA